MYQSLSSCPGSTMSVLSSRTPFTTVKAPCSFSWPGNEPKSFPPKIPINRERNRGAEFSSTSITHRESSYTSSLDLVQSQWSISLDQSQWSVSKMADEAMILILLLNLCSCIPACTLSTNIISWTLHSTLKQKVLHSALRHLSFFLCLSKFIGYSS